MCEILSSVFATENWKNNKNNNSNKTSAYVERKHLKEKYFLH